MIRRLKADVKIQLPDKNEQVLFCRLTDYQCELYRDYIQSSTVEAMLDRGKEVFIKDHNSRENPPNVGHSEIRTPFSNQDTQSH